MTSQKNNYVNLKVLIGLSLCGVLLYIAIVVVGNPLIPDERDGECSRSPYNIYTNRTEATYFRGNCYVEKCEIYETREVCRSGGLFGLSHSCYESDEPRGEMSCYDVCFDLETGERC